MFQPAPFRGRTVMDVALIGVFVIFAGTLIGIFWTKTVGFGKYTTSVLVLTLVLFTATLALVLGRVEWVSLANLLFAIAGFAGGLATAKIGES